MKSYLLFGSGLAFGMAILGVVYGEDAKPSAGKGEIAADPVRTLCDPEAKRAVSNFDEYVARARKEMDDKIAKARKELLFDLELVQDKLTMAKQADEAAKVRNARTAIADGKWTGLPGDPIVGPSKEQLLKILSNKTWYFHWEQLNRNLPYRYLPDGVSESADGKKGKYTVELRWIVNHDGTGGHLMFPIDNKTLHGIYTPTGRQIGAIADSK